MKRFTCLFVFLLVVSTFATAQKCSKYTILGTYAFQISGSVLAGSPPTATSPLTTNAIHRDNVMVGIVTYRPDGIVSGFLWQANGTQSSLDKVPWQANYTIHEDCTGYYEYMAPGAAEKAIRENFVVFDNGYEIRMMLAMDGTAAAAKMPFALMNYGGTAYRINRLMAPHCSTQTLRGARYVATCGGSMVQDVSAMGGLMVLSTNSMIGIKVGWDNSITADHVVKVGPSLKDFSVTGAVNLNEDCTLESDFIYTDPAFSGTVKVRGVMFDHGDRAFVVPLFTALPDGNSFPFQGWTCSWKRMPSLEMLSR